MQPSEEVFQQYVRSFFSLPCSPGSPLVISSWPFSRKKQSKNSRRPFFAGDIWAFFCLCLLYIPVSLGGSPPAVLPFPAVAQLCLPLASAKRQTKKNCARALPPRGFDIKFILVSVSWKKWKTRRSQEFVSFKWHKLLSFIKKAGGATW